MDNIADKIRKLLAKASSNNEHEASAALLKARELMAKYKIDEQSVKDAAPRENVLRHVEYEEDTFSGLRNAWFLSLSQVIAENHCCAKYSATLKGHKTSNVIFTGLDDDPNVALEVFSYAVQHIHNQVKEYGRYIREAGVYPAKDIRRRIRAYEDSYAEGFTRGLAAKYAEQVKNDHTGTMAITIVQPVEVTDFMDSLRKTTFARRYNGENEHAVRAGYAAGYTFNPVKQIPGT